MNNSDGNEFPIKGFVRRIASSFSSKSTNSSHNIKKPNFFSKSCPLRSSFNSVSDIKKQIESNANSSIKITSKIDRSTTSVLSETAKKKKKTNSSQFQVEETLNGVNIQIKNPHLISVISVKDSVSSASVKRTSIRIYPLKTGRTLIGSDPSNDIVLKAGRSIEADHCFIENRKAVDGGRMVTLYPIAKFCAVEGVLIDEPYLITSGSMICLGESEYFRYNHPNENENSTDTPDDEIIISSSENTSESTSSYKSAKSANISTKTSVSSESEKIFNDQSVNQSFCGAPSSPSNKKIPSNKGQLKTKDRDRSVKGKRTVRFNLPTEHREEQENVPRSDFYYPEGHQLNWIANAKKIFSDQDSKKDRNSEKLIKPIIKKNKPSDTFLSKINIFEQLARGIPISGDAKTQPVLTNTTPNMPQSGVDKRTVKSRSFGCEKELHKDSKQIQWTAPKSKSKSGKRTSKKPKNVIESAEAAKNLSISAKAFIMEKINFIDDEDRSSNGDNSDAIIDDLENGTNLDDTDESDNSQDDGEGGGTSCESLSGLSHINEDLKCRSAPITPTRMSPTMNMTQNNDYQYNETCLMTVIKQQANQNNYNTTSFIYNMNLYDDHGRVKLLNDKEEFDREYSRLNNKQHQAKQKKTLMTTPAYQQSIGLSSNASSSLSSSDSSISSLNNCYTMEPLVIEEDVDVRALIVANEKSEQEIVEQATAARGHSLASDKIVEETEEDMVEEMKEVVQSNKLTERSSCSSSASLQITSASDKAESDDHPKSTPTLTNRQSDATEEEENCQLIKTSQIDDSFNDIEEPEEDQTDEKKETEEDAEPESICSAATETTTSQADSPSLANFKSDYKRAKRERRMEEEQAEIEKLRLQEILDLCMEFQEQEERKSAAKEMKNSSSGNSSLCTTSSLTNGPDTKSSESARKSTETFSSSSNEELSSGSLYNASTSSKKQHKEQTLAQSVKSPVDSAALESNSNNERKKTASISLSNAPYVNIKQRSAKALTIVEQLSREKCELIASLKYLKQTIHDIEMRQNQAIQDLEMERALLDIEHNNQFKNIQNDEAKLKHLQQEHQLRIEAFNMHTEQIRNEIELVQMTMKNVENEILILDTSLDSQLGATGLSYAEKQHLDSLKYHRQHALEESKRSHEDLEFQLMELEAKYESELEDIQNRLIREQDKLLNAFKQRQANLVDYDQQQTMMLMAVKAQTECLESERQKLIDQFKKQRSQLHQIEKKLSKLQQQQDEPIQDVQNKQQSQQSPQQHSPGLNQSHESTQSSDKTASTTHELPSPASSSISLSSASNTPPPSNQSNNNQNTNSTAPITTASSTNYYCLNNQNPYQFYNTNVTQTPNRYIPPSSASMATSSRYNTIYHTQKSNNPQQPQQPQQQYNKQLSQSFRDILENTFLINGLDEMVLNDNIYQSNNRNGLYLSNHGTLPSARHNSQTNFMTNSSTSLSNNKSISNNIQPVHDKTVSNQIALKFAELERSLARTKAENNSLLEQQLLARERELQLLQNEKRKRSELERQLCDEMQIRAQMAQENIQLRQHKKPAASQARPLTRYLPIRDNDFDLRHHLETSGHQAAPEGLHIDAHSCRGYLLKMGQKFKTWNKRWFVFDRQKRTLCYYLDKSESKLRGSIYFQSISEVYVDHMRAIKSPDSKSTFVVKTFDRSYHLVAPSSELMRIWVEVVITGAEGYLQYND